MSGMSTPRPAWAERVARTLAPVQIRNPSRPGDRTASVLLPLVDRDGDAHLLGIVRADRGRHGGQFALPGGSTEPGDATSWDTAVRETCEEIGVARGIERLGALGEFNTFVSRYRVQVHVGYVPAEPPAWRLQEDEVQAVLRIPLARLAGLARDLPRVDDVWHLPIEAGFELDPERFRVAGTVPPRGRGHRLENRRGTFDMPYVWGLTARILYVFLREVWAPVESS